MPSLDDLVEQINLNPIPGGLTAAPSLQAPIVAPASNGSPGVLFGNQPSNMTKLTNKWSELAPLRQQFTDDVWSALIDHDAERVARGSQPLTREQTIKAAVSARDNIQATPEPLRSTSPLKMFSNAVGDLKTILGGIPKLPIAAVKEVQALPTIPQEIARAQAAGANPLEAIASAPGIRMLPGAFIAQNLTNPGEYARHPLFTVLDLLPAGKALAAGTDVARAGAEAAQVAGRTPNPIRDVLTRRLGAEGLERNQMGRAVDAFMQQTRPGQFLAQTFGRDARDVARLAHEEGAKIAAVRDQVTPARDGYEKMLQDAATMAERHQLSPEDVIAATRMMQAGDYSQATGNQLAFISEARDLTYAQGQRLTAEDLMGQVTVDGRVEFYPKDVAARLNQTRNRAGSYERLSVIRDEMRTPTGQLSLDDFERGLQQAADTWQFDRELGAAEARGIIYTLDGYGYDTASLRKALRTGKDPAQVLDLFRTSRASLVPDEMMELNDIVSELRKHKSDIMADRLAVAIADGNPTRITATLGQLMNRTKFRLPVSDDARFVRSVRSVRDRIRLDNSTLSKYTPERAERMAARAEGIVNRHAPARFEPLIGETARRKVTEQVMPKSATPEQAAEITRLITESNWKDAASLTGQDAATFEKLVSETVDDVRATWRELQARGADPVFVHRTTRGRASIIANPRVGPVPVTLSQARERFTHWGDFESDVTVSLGHQAMEMLNRQATENFVEHVVKSYGIKEADIRSQFSGRARDDVAAVGGTFEQSLRDRVDQQFEVFNPDQAGYNWGGARLDQFRQDRWLIPKPLAANLHKMASPAGPIQTLFDPISKTFRMSVIGLSPRTHLYNILGGAVMLFGETGPRGFTNLQRAWQMVKNPAQITDETLRASIGSGKQAWTNEDFARAGASVRAGRTMARVLGEANQAGASRAVQAGKQLIDKSLTFNSMVDDMYRTAAYLSGHDKALTKGLSKSAAEAAGRELMRKTMMDWTSMTPIERGVFKAVFPFYGFMRHSLGYVARYPVDHPLRASVVAAFGRAEQEDLGALPGSFLSSLFLGADDANRNALQLSGVNPFGDVGNLFTVAGFLSATNPAISTVLEQAGLVRGEAELYPTLRYDPETGRLTAQHSNPLMAFVENTIPQTTLLTSLLGVNAQFNEQMRYNPAAARRSLASSVGLPVVWRNYNVPGEIAKAEVARQKSEDAARVNALETGNWTEALRYPGLQQYHQALQMIPPELLAAYQPQTKEAIVGQLQLLTQPGATSIGSTRGGGM
jgi:hypothetical protein